MITKFAIYDWDGTVSNSPKPSSGKRDWEKAKGIPYPHIGWWGRKESLDLDVHDFNLYSDIVKRLKSDIASPETYVIILTSRQEKLRPELEKILVEKGIRVDKLVMQKGRDSKGDVVLGFVSKMPDLKQVDVYDDNYEREIVSYLSIRDKMPKGVVFNIHYVNNGETELVESNDVITHIIREEIEKLF